MNEINYNFIGIYSENVFSTFDIFDKTGKYCALPLVVCAVNKKTPELFSTNNPFSFFYDHMSLKELDNMSHKERADISFLQNPQESYLRLQFLAANNMEGVLADLISTVIVNKIKKFCDQQEKNIFFINRLHSDKLIGRLGYLYLNLNKNIISFVTYKASDLITNVACIGRPFIQFDINYFSYNPERERSDIYPCDYRESLLQTFLYNLNHNDDSTKNKLPPLRLDLFSQGLSNKQIKDNAEEVSKLLNEKGNLSPPFQKTEKSDKFFRIPMVLYKSMNATETQYREKLTEKLERVQSNG